MEVEVPDGEQCAAFETKLWAAIGFAGVMLPSQGRNSAGISSASSHVEEATTARPPGRVGADDAVGQGSHHTSRQVAGVELCG